MERGHGGAVLVGLLAGAGGGGLVANLSQSRLLGAIAMKVIGAGVFGGWAGRVVPTFDKERLTLLPAAAIRHVLQDRRIHMLCTGMRLKNDIDANIRTLSGDVTCMDADRALLAEFGPQALNSDAMKKLRTE